jgi:hypothetical protein
MTGMSQYMCIPLKNVISQLGCTYQSSHKNPLNFGETKHTKFITMSMLIINVSPATDSTWYVCQTCAFLTQRESFLYKINRANWAPNEESRICSAHFVEGWHSDDPNDVNYRPTLFSYKEKIPSESETHRSDRHTKWNLLQVIH